jgi:hypothetical protein
MGRVAEGGSAVGAALQRAASESIEAANSDGPIRILRQKPDRTALSLQTPNDHGGNGERQIDGNIAMRQDLSAMEQRTVGQKNENFRGSARRMVALPLPAQWRRAIWQRPACGIPSTRGIAQTSHRKPHHPFRALTIAGTDRSRNDLPKDAGAQRLTTTLQRKCSVKKQKV